MQIPTGPTILSLCDLTGVLTDPYRAAGYQVFQFDVQRDPREDIRCIDFTQFTHVKGVVMQVPCTHLASSGARWWKGKGPEALHEALELVWHCMRAVSETNPDWHVLENPVGRLVHHIGPSAMRFQPHEYAGWLDGEEAQSERYTKKTCLWGNFTHPTKRDLGDLHGSKMHRVSPGPNRANIRSRAPRGFAEAFFAANP